MVVRILTQYPFCHVPGLIAELVESEEMHDGRWSIQAKLTRRVKGMVDAAALLPLSLK